MKYVLFFGGFLVLIWLIDCLTGLAVRRHRQRERPPRDDWPDGDY